MVDTPDTIKRVAEDALLYAASSNFAGKAVALDLALRIVRLAGLDHNDVWCPDSIMHTWEMLNTTP